MKIFRKIAVLIIGFVFFVAGVLKLMDPVGTGLLVGEYFNFLHVPFLEPASRAIGVICSFFEAFLGAMLLTDVWKKTAAVLSVVSLSFFTLLTLALWIFNPAMECGCFGEAIHLTHSQSFLKNVILSMLWVVAFIPFSRLSDPPRIKYVSFSVAACSLAAFTLYSLLSVPLVDHTPFEPGAELMKPSDPELDAPVMVAVYEKNGKEGSFYPDVLPDSTWTFVRNELMDKNLPIYVDGEVALPFFDANGEYRDTLATAGRVALISAYDPGKLNHAAWQRIAGLISEASSIGYTSLLLVSADPDGVESVIGDQSLLPYVYFADRRTLMTLNRSNGGLSVAADGAIVGKWAARSYPDAKKLNWVYCNEPSEIAMKSSSKGRIRLQGFLLYTFAVMLLI